MKKENFEITNIVSETLLICLYGRAVESKRKNPLITDKSAEELVEKIDYDFSKFKNKRSSSVGNSLRAVHFDNMVKNFISERPNPVVVLVGCGLDARVQRLGKTAEKAIFYELDLPDVIEVRKKLIPPQKNEILISGSMLETDWLERLLSEQPNGDFIFIIEGVLMYFDEKDNRFILTEIAKHFKNAEIHFDISSKWMSRNSKKHVTVGKTKAEFKFGIDNPKEVENWSPNLEFIKSYRYTDFKGYKQMGFPFSFLMRFIPQFKNSFKLFAFRTK